MFNNNAFPLTDSLQSVLKQLCDMKLEKQPFVILSVIGQDLLAHGQYQSAVEVYILSSVQNCPLLLPLLYILTLFFKVASFAYLFPILTVYFYLFWLCKILDF